MRDDVAAERLGLADQLAELGPDEWTRPSLCEGWTVHDVVAHLTLSADQPLLWTLLRMIPARGDYDRISRDDAVARAREFSPPALIGQLRDLAVVDRRFPLAGPLDPLNDLLVHGQDLTIPLGRERAVPVERAVPCLDHIWTAPFVGAAKRFAGLRLMADDAEWSRGDGPEVRGPSSGLLLALNGRVAGLDRLTGEGLDEARRRFR